jgi:hypothetical protein
MARKIKRGSLKTQMVRIEDDQWAIVPTKDDFMEGSLRGKIIGVSINDMEP